MEIEAINTRELLNKQLPVHVIHVLSPTLFWVRLKSNEEEFHKFTAEMNLKVTLSKSRIQNPKEQDYVTIKRDLLWLRGIITRILRRGQTAEVALQDMGLSILVPINEIYHLEDEFRKLPWQAICCGLANIGTFAPDTVWPTEVRKITQLLAEGEGGTMQIMQPLWPGAAFIKLDIKSRYFDASYNFRYALIRLGHARAIEKLTEHIFPSL